MPRKIAVVLLAGSALLGLSRAAKAGSARSAFKAFAKLMAERATDADRKAAFTSDGLAKERDVDGKAARHALLVDIADAKRVKVREKDGRAVARFERAGERGVVREVPLRRVGDAWKLDAPRSYVVAGDDLAVRVNDGPAQQTLTLRRGGAYAKSAYCFANATGDPADCKNRMDLWVCHNRDVHPSGGARIADLGPSKLDRIDGIPVGAEWSERAIPIKAGHVYVVHCLSSHRRDFYVAFRVKSFVGDSVEIEWTLLTAGLDAPASIHRVEKDTSTDGADGTDGLCARR